MAESFFSALKNERVYRTVHATKAQRSERNGRTSSLTR